MNVGQIIDTMEPRNSEMAICTTDRLWRVSPPPVPSGVFIPQDKYPYVIIYATSSE